MPVTLGVKSHNWLLRQTRSFEDKSACLEGDDQDSGCATVWPLVPTWDTASWTGGHYGPNWPSIFGAVISRVGPWRQLHQPVQKWEDSAASFSVLILVLSLFSLKGLSFFLFLSLCCPSSFEGLIFFPFMKGWQWFTFWCHSLVT